jgi:hypothetical protein
MTVIKQKVGSDWETILIGEQGDQGPPGPQGSPGRDGAATLPYFVVTDYGVVGDGVADDTAAIQAAIDACAADDGGEVRFPAGFFNISAPIIVPEGVSLWGVGGAWAKVQGAARPLTLFKCMTATAKVIVRGGGGTFGNFTIDGRNVADGPLLHRDDVSAKRLFMSMFLTRSKLEAWRIDFAQNDVHIDMHMYWNYGAGLVLDKGAGGLAFYGCEFGGCTTWHLIIDETAGTGPYSAPSHNTFDHCLFELANNIAGAPNTLQGCIWIKTGKRTVFRDCACNPVVAPSVGCVKIDGSGMGADPIVIFDGFWFASAAAGATGIIQDAGTLLLSGNTEFTGFLNAWRFNGGSAQVVGPITYSGTTNRWDPAGTGDIRTLVGLTANRPIRISMETTDLWALRVAPPGAAGASLDIGPTGTLAWGAGTGATDTTLARASANRLHASGALRAAGTLEAAAAFAHQGTTAGFYNVTPVTRATVPAAATDPATTMALVNALRTALVNLGLVQ